MTTAPANDLHLLASQPAMCLTLITGVARASQLVERFGTDPDATRQPTPIHRRQAADLPSLGTVDTSDGSVGIEVNGFQGNRCEVLTAISTNGRAASVYWGANQLGLVTFADHGHILGVLDVGHLRHGSDEHAQRQLITLMSDLAFLPGTSLLDCLTAAQRFTGIRLPAEAVLDCDAYTPLLPLLDQLAPPDTRDGLWRLAMNDATDDPGLVASLVSATRLQQRRFACWTADWAIHKAGLLHAPQLSGALRATPQTTGGRLDPEVDLTIRRIIHSAFLADRTDSAHVNQSTRAAVAKGHAAEAVHAAITHPDPIDAALTAVSHARWASTEPEAWHLQSRAQVQALAR